jgi:N-hydroxyarylamine O-acetyltransferase
VPFTNVLIVERVGDGKRYKLANRRFVIESRDGEVIADRSIESVDELRQVLDETFNVTPPAPVDDIFARLGN